MAVQPGQRFSFVQWSYRAWRFLDMKRAEIISNTASIIKISLKIIRNKFIQYYILHKLQINRSNILIIISTYGLIARLVDLGFKGFVQVPLA